MSHDRSQDKGYSEPEQVLKRLITAATNPRDRAYAATLGKTGIPVSEANNLEVTNIDFERATFTFEHHKERVRLKCATCDVLLGKRHLFCPNCGTKVDEATREKIEPRRQRVIPVDPDTLRLIDEYLKWRRQFPYRGSLVFPFSRMRGWQIIEKLGRRAGIKGLHPSSFRQMFIMRWITKDLDTKKLEILLGHASYIDSDFEALRLECRKMWEPTEDEERPE